MFFPKTYWIHIPSKGLWRLAQEDHQFLNVKNPVMFISKSYNFGTGLRNRIEAESPNPFFCQLLPSPFQGEGTCFSLNLPSFQRTFIVSKQLKMTHTNPGRPSISMMIRLLF